MVILLVFYSQSHLHTIDIGGECGYALVMIEQRIIQKESRKKYPVHVLHIAPGTGLWGAERSILQLVRDFSSRDYRCLLLVSGKGALEEEALRSNIPVVSMSLESPKKIISFIHGVMLLRRLCQKHDIQIIHAHHPRGNLFAAFATIFSRRRCVWHCRNLPECNMIDYEKYLSFLPDGIIAISNVVARRFFPVLTGQKLYTLPNAVRETFFEKPVQRNIARESLSLPLNVNLVGFLSRFDERKRPGILFHLIPDILIENPDTHFLFVEAGDPIQISAMKRFTEEHRLEPIVHWVRFQEDPFLLLDSIDILFHPARDEAFGRIIIEAGARCVPSLVYRDGGPCEWIEDGVNGFLFKDEKEDLLEKIRILLSDPGKRIRMGKRAREDFHGKFTMKRLIMEMEQVYRFVMSFSISDLIFS